MTLPGENARFAGVQRFIARIRTGLFIPIARSGIMLNLTEWQARPHPPQFAAANHGTTASFIYTP